MLPVTRSSLTPGWHSNAPQEPKHLLNTSLLQYLGYLMEDNGAEQSKGTIRPDPMRFVWLQRGIYRTLNSLASVQLPRWSIIHMQHPFRKSGCNLNSDLFAWTGHRLEPRYPSFCRRDPMSSHRSPGWQNPALLPTHAVKSFRKPGL